MKNLPLFYFSYFTLIFYLFITFISARYCDIDYWKALSHLSPNGTLYMGAGMKAAYNKKNEHFYWSGGVREIRPSNLPPFPPFSNQTIKYNLEDKSSVFVKESPITNAFHSLFSHGKYLYMFGGAGAFNQDNSFFRYDTELDEWTNISQSVSSSFPVRRVFPAVATKGRYTYIFGGIHVPFYDGLSGIEGDLWVFDSKHETFTKLANATLPGQVGPSARVAAYLSVWEDKLVLYAGEAPMGSPALQFLDDLWTFSLVNKTWTLEDQFKKSSNKLMHGVHAFHVNELHIISGDHGSCSDDLISKEIRIFDMTTKTWRYSVAKQPLKRAAIAVSGNKALIAGGYNGGCKFNCSNYQCSTCSGFQQTYNDYVYMYKLNKV